MKSTTMRATMRDDFLKCAYFRPETIYTVYKPELGLCRVGMGAIGWHPQEVQGRSPQAVAAG
jgi:hypothetical protein